jgi:hypothetical protein
MNKPFGTVVACIVICIWSAGCIEYVEPDCTYNRMRFFDNSVGEVGNGLDCSAIKPFINQALSCLPADLVGATVQALDWPLVVYWEDDPYLRGRKVNGSLSVSTYEVQVRAEHGMKVFWHEIGHVVKFVILKHEDGGHTDKEFWRHYDQPCFDSLDQGGIL